MLQHVRDYIIIPIVYSRVVALSFVIILAGLIFLLLKPFLSAILLAGILAYLFYPLNKRVRGWLPQNWPASQIAAAITCLIVTLGIMLPLVFIVVTLIRESDVIFLLLERLNTLSLAKFLPLLFIPQEWLTYLPTPETLLPYLSETVLFISTSIALTLPGLLVSIILTLVLVYYFLVMARDLYQALLDCFPFLKQGHLLIRFDGLCQGMVKGQILVGIVQGLLMALVCLLLAVPSAVFLGFMTTIVSVIPFLGAAMVWLPVVGYLLFLGEWFKAMILLAAGALVISTIDNLLKPKIVGQRAQVHPLLVLLGILGGIQVFGIVGILIGPFILTSLDIVLQLFKETF